MRRETLGVALFFCGIGIQITLFCPWEGWFWKVATGVVLMILGLKTVGCR